MSDYPFQCKLCGRELDYPWWKRWLAGSVCTGKDLQACKERFIYLVLKEKLDG